MKKLLLPISLILALSMCGCTVPGSNDSSEESEPVTEDIAEIVTEPEVVSPYSEIVQQKLDTMSVHDKVCQLFVVTPESLTGYDWQSEWDEFTTVCYDYYPVGGIIMYDTNIFDPDQTSEFVSALRSMAKEKGVDVFMAVDEEGGDVARLTQRLGGDFLNNMSYYGEMNDYSTAYGVGQTLGHQLVQYAFNLDFAPVADVTINPFNELGDRIFSSDPQVVADMSGAVIDGLHSCGVSATLKHFPGLGASDGSLSFDSVYIDRKIEELRENEFKAFKGGIDSGADFVMVGHQVTSASGDNLPGDLSSVVINDWLKGELGFEGIVITDSHNMGAIINSYSSGEAAVKAIQAGADMILMPYELSEAVEALEKAVESGEITVDRLNESVGKILEKKRKLSLISESKSDESVSVETETSEAASEEITTEDSPVEIVSE